MNASKTESLTIKEKHDWYVNKVKTLFTENPAVFILAYLSAVFENQVAYDDNCTLRVPKYAPTLMTISRFVQKTGYDIIILILFIAGLILMIRRGQYFPAVLLGLIYLYFIALSGFTLWQGSRIMYPAQVSWLFPVSIAIHRIYRFIGNKLSTGR
jgi:hypothetical protein